MGGSGRFTHGVQDRVVLRVRSPNEPRPARWCCYPTQVGSASSMTYMCRSGTALDGDHIGPQGLSRLVMEHEHRSLLRR